MNMLETTVSMLETLPEADVQAIYTMTKSIYERKKRMPLLSAEQLLEELRISREQEKNGQFRPAKEAIQSIQVKYGL